MTLLISEFVRKNPTPFEKASILPNSGGRIYGTAVMFLFKAGPIFNEFNTSPNDHLSGCSLRHIAASEDVRLLVRINSLLIFRMP